MQLAVKYTDRFDALDGCNVWALALQASHREGQAQVAARRFLTFENTLLQINYPLRERNARCPWMDKCRGRQDAGSGPILPLHSQTIRTSVVLVKSQTARVSKRLKDSKSRSKQAF